MSALTALIQLRPIFQGGLVARGYTTEGVRETMGKYDAAVASLTKLMDAAIFAEELFAKALPKFNWGASALDAQAIRLLNEVPGEVRAALKEVQS